MCKFQVLSGIFLLVIVFALADHSHSGGHGHHQHHHHDEHDHQEKVEENTKEQQGGGKLTLPNLKDCTNSKNKNILTYKMSIHMMGSLENNCITNYL